MDVSLKPGTRIKIYPNCPNTPEGRHYPDNWEVSFNPWRGQILTILDGRLHKLSVHSHDAYAVKENNILWRPYWFEVLEDFFEELEEFEDFSIGRKVKILTITRDSHFRPEQIDYIGEVSFIQKILKDSNGDIFITLKGLHQNGQDFYWPINNLERV